MHADTYHVGICPRAGVQVAQHKPLNRTISHVLKHVFIARIVEGGAPFLADRNLWKGIVLSMGSSETPRSRRTAQDSVK